MRSGMKETLYKLFQYLECITEDTSNTNAYKNYANAKKVEAWSTVC